ncbi:MAG TPA: hypothetical protein VEV83_09575 [Parafilimonas sp.]|nr:hypothetical protein [Parafilimonas sp.]
MKRPVIILTPLLLAVTSLALVSKNFDHRSVSSYSTRSSPVIGCAPDAGETFYADDNGNFITILPGWGDHAYSITTENDSAQVYFNQGLTMYYGYHPREAIASFKQAAKFDSTCAMAYWGEALAMGPTYNGGYSYKMNKGVPAAIELMDHNAANCTEKEKDLISAMKARYNLADTADTERKRLNKDYVEVLRPLVAKYPADLDVKALFVDAVMLVHPWDFWNTDGTPKSWTPELVQCCKDILAKDPHHPAALHYYIHVTEASRTPEVALPSADSLKKLFPGIAHMVHMSSHEYERIGYYAQGVEVNDEADESLGRYASLAQGLNLTLHSSHYYAVYTYCALSGGMYKRSIEKGMALRNLVHPNYENTNDQYLYMFPLLAMVRMGKWQDIIADNSSISSDWKYAGVLDDFAKGMAYAKTGNVAKAETFVHDLREKQKDSVLRARFIPHVSSPYPCSVIAENILVANIAFRNKKYNEAFTAINNAIISEDSLVYAEPNSWMLPARQYLGAFLLKLNKPAQAEKVYREDLVRNPGNGWSLLGLYQSLQAQEKTAELEKLKALFTNSFSQADSFPSTSAY